jgi:uncharacterized protein
MSLLPRALTGEVLVRRSQSTPRFADGPLTLFAGADRVNPVDGVRRREPFGAGLAAVGMRPRGTLRRMSTFVFRLRASRPSFALDMTDEEREVMGRHAAYWKPLIDSGQMVVSGPVLDSTGSWGLGVVEADDEEELRRFRGG